MKTRHLTQEEEARLDAIDDDWRRPLGCPLLYLKALDDLEEALDILSRIPVVPLFQQRAAALIEKHRKGP